MYSPRQAVSARTRLVALTLSGLALAATSVPVLAGQPASAGQEDFGKYLADHQADLAPFFNAHGSELLGQGVPLLLDWLGRILFVALILGWVVDLFLARGFARLFASDSDKFRPAFFYATGRLAINSFLLVMMGIIVTAVVGTSNLGAVIAFIVVVFGLIAAVLQIGWICYFFRSNPGIAVLFYLTLMAVHGFLTLGVATPLSNLPASESSLVFMNCTVAPRVEVEARTVRRQLPAIAPESDRAADEAAHLQASIEEGQAEQVHLRNEIHLAKNSASYAYSQGVKVHARGDLVAARDQFTALLARFPNGPVAGLARGQLTQVQSEIAAQEAQERQAAADRIHVAASAQASLLSRASKGQATLSELRNALLGKTRPEVSALFGPPTDTASDRWGFGRQMVFNPLTNERSGLAIYFADGCVQSVDYYYGRETAK